LWAILPFALLVLGVYGFAQLSEHAAWSDGTTFLVGALMFMLFVAIVGPVAALPSAVKTSVDKEERDKPVVDLMSALKASVEEAELAERARRGSVSTREGTQTRYRRLG
jgi:hypothetical protein